MFLLTFAATCVHKFAREAVSLIDSLVMLIRKILAVDFMVVSGVLTEIMLWARLFFDFLIAVGIGLNHTIHDFASFIWDLVDITVRCLMFLEATLMQLMSMIVSTYLSVASVVISCYLLLRSGVTAIWFTLILTIHYMQYLGALIIQALIMVFQLMVSGFALIPAAIKSITLTPFDFMDSCFRYIFSSFCQMSETTVASVVGAVMAVPADAYMGLLIVLLWAYLCHRYAVHHWMWWTIDRQARQLEVQLRPLWAAIRRGSTELVAGTVAGGFKAWDIICRTLSCWMFFSYYIVSRTLMVRSYLHRQHLTLWQGLLRAAPARTAPRPTPGGPLRRSLNRSSSLSSSSDEDELFVEMQETTDKAHGSGQNVDPGTIRKLQLHLARMQESALCIVCQDLEKSVVLLPCRHFCLCQGCAVRIGNADALCPVCRRDIGDTMLIYS